MKLQVIIGSTRHGRVSDRIAQWVANEAKTLSDVDVEIIDLVDYPLPFFDEPLPPQYNPARQPVDVAKKFLDKLTKADAYVVVSPEYNRALPGVLKNALEYVDFQMANKPVALVVHGSTGGAQSLATLRVTLPALKVVTTPTPTMVTGRAGELIDESGELVDEEIKANPYGPQAALQTTLSELKMYAEALNEARAKIA